MFHSSMCKISYIVIEISLLYFRYYDDDENTEKKLKGQGNILMGYTNVTKQRFRIATFYAQRNWIFQFTKDTDMEFWIQFCNQTSRFSTSISAVVIHYYVILLLFSTYT